MHILGILVFVTGFMGVPAMGVLYLVRSIPVVLITHFLLVLTCAYFLAKQHGGFSNWRRIKIHSINSIHPSVIILVGLLFVAGGLNISLTFQAGGKPNSMTREEQIYFGSTIICNGCRTDSHCHQ
ncbi:MAG: hypothetical protein Tsb009_34540 [Planctomycetaceae bacterium]